jgi:hypothetical protein
MTGFKRELLRAKEQEIRLYVFVECERDTFISKKFSGGSRLKCPPRTLACILSTMTRKYDMEIVWCKNRDTMKLTILEFFEQQENG